MHSSGALDHRPFTSYVQLTDVHHGNIVEIVADTPGSLNADNNLAISHDGSQVYLADNSGMRVLTLDSFPLSIGSLTPASVPATGGTTMGMRGSALPAERP